MTECSTRVFREGWLANWFITERVTGLRGSCIQLTQSDMSAHGLIVVKEITHTQTHTHSGNAETGFPENRETGMGSKLQF